MIAAPTTFADSALDAGARRARGFEQRALLRACPGLRGSPGLCAVLVRLWWRAQRRGGDLLDDIAAFGSGLEEELGRLVLEALAPAHLPPDGECGEADRRLLELKYGTCDVGLLGDRLRERGCTDLRELDLTLHLGARLVGRRRAVTWSGVADGLLAPQAAPLLTVVGVASASTSSPLSSGHRFALAWTGGAWSFFDPNFGEAVFPAGPQIRSWMDGLGRVSGYASRVAATGGGARLWHLVPGGPDPDDPGGDR